MANASIRTSAIRPTIARRSRLGLGLFASTALTMLATPAQAAVFVATDEATLIAAINAANATAGADTIVLNNSVTLTGALPQITDLTTFDTGAFQLVAASGDPLIFNSNGLVQVASGGAIGGNVRAIYNFSGTTLTVINQGTISAASLSSNAIQSAGSLVLNNSGTISNPNGIAFCSIAVDGVATITNSGSISGGQVCVNGANSQVTNSGTISGNSGTNFLVMALVANSTLDNSGAITSVGFGVRGIGAGATILNSGSLTADVGYATAIDADGSITNNGTLTGGTSASFGYGAILGRSNGNVTLTNQSGGTIGGTAGSIRAAGAGIVTIDLQTGSVANGDIDSVNDGARIVTVDGTLNGAYDASAGAGVDRIVLGALGSMGSASLGGGDDLFVTHGGTVGTIDGGAGTDGFIADLATGTNASLDLAALTNVESLTKLNGGTFTLTGFGANGDMAILAGDGGNDDGVLAFDGTSGLTSDIFVNGAIIRADSEGAFGSGTIHMIDPTIQYGATGSYANDIILASADPAGDPSRFEAINGSTATLTGSVTEASGGQPLVIGGDGTIVLANAANAWTGGTTVEFGATLQGASNTISGSNIVADGSLNYVQASSGTVAQDISGAGRVGVSGLGAGQSLTFAGNLTNSGINLTDGSSIAFGGAASVTSGTALHVTGANASVSVNAGGSVSGSGTTILSDAAGTSVTNNGSIGGYIGVALNGGGTVTNGSATNAGATIVTSGSGITQNNMALVTVDNYGLIQGYYNAIDGNDYAVTNHAGATLYGVTGYGVLTIAGSSTIDNDGLIQGGDTGVNALASAAVTNGGTILGGYIGASLYGGGTIVNGSATNSTALIQGGNTGSYNGSASVTVDNYGVIRGTNYDGIGGGNLNVTNHPDGQIIGQGNASQYNSFGIVDSGSLTLDNAGQIVGRFAGVQSAGALSVTNSGLIGSGYLSGTTFSYSDGNDGVRAMNGGTIDNLAGGDIRGSISGIYAQNSLLTLGNAGTIAGGSNGIYAAAPIALTNLSSGSISGANNAVFATGGISSVTNSGTISSGGQGVYLASGGSVDNLAGTISGGTAAWYLRGILIQGSNGSVTNAAGATISGGRGVDFEGVGGTVINAGTINGAVDGVMISGTGGVINQIGGTIAGNDYGIRINGANSTISNSGAITASSASPAFNAVRTDGANAMITNTAGGSISGAKGVVLYGSGTVTNAGSISGTAASFGDAIQSFSLLTVTNQAGGTIGGTRIGVYGQGAGLTLTNGGAIGGSQFGAVYTSGGTNSITNYSGATITGTGSAMALNLRGATTVDNSGGLSATTSAVGLFGGGTFINQVGGTVSSTNGRGVEVNSGVAGANRIENYGTIDAGSFAVMIFNGGTIINGGSVTAGATGNALTLVGGGSLTNLVGGTLTAIDAPDAWGMYAEGSSAATIDNRGTINAGSGLVTNGANTTMINSGDVFGSKSGVLVLGGVGSALTNSGTIASATGIGVDFSGGGTITNLSGGTIGSGAPGAAIRLAGANSSVVDLQAGSTVNGLVDASASTGANSVAVAGSLNGAYLGGSAGDALSLAATGSLGSANFGAGADSLTINGGTLGGLADGGADVDALIFALAGNASFDAGNFAGFESRVKSGAGTLTLTGVDGMTTDFAVAGGGLILSGGAAINDGAAISVAGGTTLDITSNEAIRTLTGTGSVTLGSNTLILAGDDNASFGGVISGTGSLAKFGSGLFTLTGGNGYTGTTYAMGGTLAIGSSNAIAPAGSLFVETGATFDLAGYIQGFAGLGGTGAITLGAGRLTIDNLVAGQFDGVISGTGGLTKTGSGLLLLNGASSYTGSTLVTGGTLSVNGSLASTVTVNGGGTLAGIGSIGGLVVDSGGILSPGNEALLALASAQTGIGTQSFVPMASYDVFTVDGNATFNAGSFYDVDINPTMSDLTIVTGTTTINGGTVRVNAEDATYNPLTIYTILQSDGGVSGAFAAVTDNLAYLDTELSYTNNQVLLEARRNDIVFAAVAANSNQAGVANAVQSIGSGDLYDAVLVQSEDGARTAFNALSGEIYVATPTALLDESRHVRNAMLNADRDGGQGLGFWLEAMRSNGGIEVDSSRGTGEVDHDREALAGGITYGRGKLSLGVMIGRSSTDIDLDARASSAKAKSTFAGGQVGYRSGPMTVRGGAAYAWHDIDTDRDIVFPGFSEVASSSQDGRTMQLWGDAGFDLAPGGDILEPFAGFALVDSKVDGTDEDGGLAALRVGSVKQTAQFARIGLRVKGTTTLGGAVFSPRMSVALQRGWGDLDGDVTSAFDGSGSFDLTGTRLSPTSALFDAGADLEVGSAKLGVRYDGSLSGNHVDHGAKATLSVRF